MHDDVNKFMHVAATSATTLVRATDGDLDAQRTVHGRSSMPLGWGDELRVGFRDPSGVWGFMCLHRAADDGPFSDDEIAFIDTAAPHIAKAIRRSVLLGAIAEGTIPDAPGLVLFSSELDLIGTNDPGEEWLDLLAGPRLAGGVPNEVLVLAAAARGVPSSEFAHVPRIRVQTATGEWAVLHASVMKVGSDEQVAVVIEPATPTELAPLIVAAYGLTPQERRIVELVCHGASTREISEELFITANTVQDHLKSIFAKTGTGSRRELVASLLTRDYMPRAAALDPLDRRGQFTK